MKITRCKLNRKIQIKLLEFFIAQVTARTAADLLGIQPNSAALFYRKIRQIIMHHLNQDAIEVFEGQIELDESYFGGARKGKRGRGAAGKVIVFGLLKRNGKVYTVIVFDTKSSTLMLVIANKITPDSIFIKIIGIVIMLWMLQALAIIELIIQVILLRIKIISMGLRTFGIRQKEYCGNTMVLTEMPFHCLLRMRSTA